MYTKTYQIGCYLNKNKNCWNCNNKTKCDVWAYIMDLTAERFKCPNCGGITREEHTEYCPFCGIEIGDVNYYVTGIC